MSTLDTPPVGPVGPVTGPKTAIVGTGAAAKAHVSALRRLQLPPPLWVVAHSTEKARMFACDYGIDRFTDQLQVMLDDASVEVVVLATPSSQHASQTIEVLRADKHVLAEIPVGVSVSEAASLVEAATVAGRRVFACHVLRSLPAMREVKRRVTSGELDVSQVAGFFSIPRRHNEGRGGITRTWVDDLLWHHSCHQVDASLWALGFPAVRTISAVQGRRHKQYGMAMDVGLVAVTDSDQVISHSLSYNASISNWQLRFIGTGDNVLFRNGALMDEEGHEIVPQTDVFDFIGVWSDVLEALATGGEGDFALASVMPAMALLQRAADSIGPRR